MGIQGHCALQEGCHLPSVTEEGAERGHQSASRLDAKRPSVGWTVGRACAAVGFGCAIEVGVSVPYVARKTVTFSSFASSSASALGKG